MIDHIDALTVLEEVAVSLKESAEEIEIKSEFDNGRLAGYYEALSTIVSQCAIAGLTTNDIGIDGFSPDSLLIKERKAA